MYPGNQTLFMRGDEVEARWAWTDPNHPGAWESTNDVAQTLRTAGLMARTDANELMRPVNQRNGRE